MALAVALALVSPTAGCFHKADLCCLSSSVLALGRETGGRESGTEAGADGVCALPGAPGDQSEHRLALKNIASMVRPGGLLVIDHRNYDHILSTGCAPPGKNIYYKVGLLPGRELEGREPHSCLWKLIQLVPTE